MYGLIFIIVILWEGRAIGAFLGLDCLLPGEII